MKSTKLPNKKRTVKKKSNSSIDSFLHKVYYDYGNEGALNNSISVLLKLLRENGYSNATDKDVKSFLHKQTSYTVHKRLKKKQFPRRSIHITASKVRTDGDLMDMQDLASWNQGYKYIFILIDGFSKYVRVKPLKNKEANQTATALNELIKKDDFKTIFLYTDSGTEFKGKAFQIVLKENNITHRLCTANDFHCPFVERVIRTIKEKLFQAMTSSLTRKWFDLLPLIVKTYNSTIHSSTKMRPVEAKLDKNIFDVHKSLKHKMIDESPHKKKTYRFKRGDHVRILKEQSNVGNKGYLPRYTWEIFRISKLANQRPLDKDVPAYYLEDLNGDMIENAVFYEPELSYVEPQHNKLYPIREIIQQKNDKVKVWWQGDKRENATWIDRKKVYKGGTTSPNVYKQ